MHGTPRTLPPWVRSVDQDDLPELPSTPDNARLAAPVLRGAQPRPEAPRGRRFDHARTAELVTISTPIVENAARWRDYLDSTTPANIQSRRPSTGGTTVVGEEWMKENWPYNFEDPWEPQDVADKQEPLRGFWLFNPQKRGKTFKGFYRQLMNNPFVPLLVRLTVLLFSVLALSLASSLYRGTSVNTSDDEKSSCRRLSSTYMAIIFDTVAIVYVMYITYDEYTSEPLGLRSHSAKMRLIFLDLIFIVFNSANLALAFEPLFDSTWACLDNEIDNACKAPDLCHKQKALSGTLIVALVAWLVTFGISTLRIVERAVTREMASRK